MQHLNPFKHSNLSIGFSKFCSLRPRWCIATNSSDAHNVKLLVDVLRTDKAYRDENNFLQLG